MESRSRTEKLNRSFVSRFRAGQEEAYLATGTVDRVKDREIPGFHIRVRRSGSKWCWANARLTFTIGAIDTVDPDKARSLALGIKARVEARKGVQPFRPDDIRAWIASELLGMPVEPAKPGWTVAETRNRFLDHKKTSGMAAATIRGYKSELHCPEVEAIKDRRAADITPDDIAAIRDGVAQRGGVRSNRVRAALSAMFSYARGEPASRVSVNPVSGVNKRGKETKRKRFLPVHELKRFIAALPEIEISPAVGCAMAWSLATGQRKRAVREAQRTDIVDSIWHSLPKVREDDEQRALIPMTPLLKAIHKLALHYCRQKSMWLFPSDRTTYRGGLRDVPVTDSALNQVLERLQSEKNEKGKARQNLDDGRFKAKNAGHGLLRDLENFTVHDFRRTVATLCRSEGMPRSYISALLDHDDDDGSAATITGLVYDQYEPVQERRIALEKWHDILERAGFRECLVRLETKWREHT